eukprot:3300641-Amphidinium_carterae.1
MGLTKALWQFVDTPDDTTGAHILVSWGYGGLLLYWNGTLPNNIDLAILQTHLIVPEPCLST